MSLFVVALAACRSSASAPDTPPPPVDASKPVPLAQRDGAIVAPDVTRYPDETPLNEVHGSVARGCAAFSAVPTDGDAWIVETLPAGWELSELARRGDYVLVRWKPTGRGARLFGWVRADGLGRAADTGTSDGAAPCPGTAVPYGAIPCARQCWAPADCAKPARCIRTEPTGDALGLCVGPDGRLLD